MEVTKNKPLLERKFFLMRSMANDNTSEAAGQKEIDEINIKLQVNIEEALKENLPKLQADIKVLKKEQVLDGNFKRAMANYIIKLFENEFSSDELKGVFRQGYKIMRTR